MLTHKEMNLFDAPSKSILVHATNCCGVWGSGIAKTFKENFPEAFHQYKNACDLHGYACLGEGLLFEEKGFWVGCLMTSRRYGSNVDKPKQILSATKDALEALLPQIKTQKVYSPKFNSGLFAVPWEDTEAILKKVLESYPEIEWTVCTPKGM